VTYFPSYLILLVSNKNTVLRKDYLSWRTCKKVAVASLLFVTSVTRASNFSLLLPRMTLQNRDQIATFWTPFDRGCFAQAKAARRFKQISVILLCDCGDYLGIVGGLRLLRPDERKHGCCPDGQRTRRAATRQRLNHPVICCWDRWRRFGCPASLEQYGKDRQQRQLYNTGRLRMPFGIFPGLCSRHRREPGDRGQ
jgi:hypothetical protein